MYALSGEKKDTIVFAETDVSDHFLCWSDL